MALRRPRPTSSPFAVGDVALVRGTDASALLITVGFGEAWPPGSFEAVWATLLWDWETVDVPAPAELRMLPYVVRYAPLAGRQELAMGIVDAVEVEFDLVQVMSPASGKLAFANFGEIVARGVIRSDFPAVTEWVAHASWAGVAATTNAAWLRERFRLTSPER